MSESLPAARAAATLESSSISIVPCDRGLNQLPHSAQGRTTVEEQGGATETHRNTVSVRGPARRPGMTGEDVHVDPGVRDTGAGVRERLAGVEPDE